MNKNQLNMPLITFVQQWAAAEIPGGTEALTEKIRYEFNIIKQKNLNMQDTKKLLCKNIKIVIKSLPVSYNTKTAIIEKEMLAIVENVWRELT